MVSHLMLPDYKDFLSVLTFSPGLGTTLAAAGREEDGDSDLRTVNNNNWSADLRLQAGEQGEKRSVLVPCSC
eukprot:superscaffoldBa00000491_g5144